MTKTFRHAGFTLSVLCVFAAGSLCADDSQAISSRNTPLVAAVERAFQCCVDIDTEKSQKSLDVVFPSSKSSKVNGMGTGIVIDERGYIVTNYHVVEGVDRLAVTLHDGSKYDATVIQSDVKRDLSIIHINPIRPMTVMPLGTSSDLKLGEDVIAIGNAFGYKHSVTRGIISAIGRNVEVNEEQGYENLIQTDAPINPGNSGGPLLNADGELIGINVAIRQGAQKIGFTIPIDDARKVISQLLNVEKLERKYHGIATLDVKNGAERKLLVRSVEPNSPAAVSGVMSGDIVVRSQNVDVTDCVDLERSLLGIRPGQEVPVVVQRDGEEKTLKLQLVQMTGDRFRAGRSPLASVPSSSSVSVPAQSTPASPKASLSPAAEKAWKMLGLKLAPLSAGETPASGQAISGGMRVVEVRPNSPAAEKGVVQGDVLLGLHIWETVSEDNVNYVLSHPDLATLTPLKFYISRNGTTLYGHFDSMTASR